MHPLAIPSVAMAAVNAAVGAYYLALYLGWPKVEGHRQLEGRVETVMADLRVLPGLLPICASCKRIRDDGGYWQRLEDYITTHSEAVFSHGLCPECMARLYPEDADVG